PAPLRRRENGGDVEIALPGRRRADAKRLVREADMQGVRVGGGMDGDGFHAQLARRANHPQGDFTTVRDEDAVKHYTGSKRKSDSPYSTGLPFWTSTSSRRPGCSASISFISFIASTMQRTCPFFTTCPVSTNAGLSGDAER